MTRKVKLRLNLQLAPIRNQQSQQPLLLIIMVLVRIDETMVRQQLVVSVLALVLEPLLAELELFQVESEVELAASEEAFQVGLAASEEAFQVELTV